jgi:hypothetical protein
MARDSDDSYATSVVAAVLILALLFAGYWIWTYAAMGSPPWRLAGWFAIGVVLIVVGGIVRFWFGGRQ